MTETLTGTIERVTYHNPDSGFAVLRVRVRGRHDLATVTGTLTNVTAGELLEASGRWTVDRQHGPQFRAEQLRTAPPASADGIEKYLAAGAIRSIGPQLAAKIVGMYKAQTLEIFDQHPDLLLHIRGIGAKTLKRIKASWDEQRQVRGIMLFLQEHGIGAGGRAIRIYRTYGDQAIAAIKENPYRLADDIRGIGFKTADDLAARLGLDPESPARARAAVRFALQQLSQEGHCGFPQEGVIEKTGELVGIKPALIEAAIESEVQEGQVICETADEQPWLFLAPLHKAEEGLAQAIHKLASAGMHPLPSIDVEVAIDWVQRRLALELAPQQQDAIRAVCRYKLVIVTGGPGVGKTTLVRSMLEIFAAKGLKCVLAAPTGRAAKRLAETTGQEAKTVHRLLEFDPSTGDFRKNQRHPLRGDLFVLDETSMVDVVLGYQFLRALPIDSCVVLVGDVDQLPSVGPGALLADLIASGAVPVVRLTEIFRQAAESRIVTVARDINMGHLPHWEGSDALMDFYLIEADQPDSIQDLLVRLVHERIPDRFGLDPFRDIQVLAPMNRGQLGTHTLNPLLQSVLNPASEAKAETQRFGWTFRVGDRVIQTENNYDRDVFNGDLGIIESLNRVEQELVVTYEGHRVSYDFADLDELALAYVLTIHKSQGSEYPCVVIPLHTQHYVMLRRNLLYTAVTRGKSLVILVGSKRALQLAVTQEDTRHRCSQLQRRLKGG